MSTELFRVISAKRVADFHEADIAIVREKGATFDTQCATCAARVVLAPASQELVRSNEGWVVRCNQCASDQMAATDEPIIMLGPLGPTVSVAEMVLDKREQRLCGALLPDDPQGGFCEKPEGHWRKGDFKHGRAS
jgi:hypothetical protein